MREILRKSLGFDSFVASFITSVEEDDKATETACISNDGRLKVNSKFVRKHITSKEDAFCLIFHEVLHPLFNHYMYARDVLSNIACDAVINAVISLLYSEASGKGSLFRKIYAKKGIEGILRLGSDLRKSRFDGLYRNLYGDGLYRGESLSTGEVIQALKVLVQKKVIKGLLLIGSHAFGKRRPEGDLRPPAFKNFPLIK